MAINSEKFKYNSAFRADASLYSVRFSRDTPLLETELNEMQDIQNEQRQSIARTFSQSGFIELVSKDYAYVPIIYQPVNAFTNVLNSIAIAPCKAIVNGITINLTGNFSTDNASNYILLDLGEAPDSGVRNDLVYLEVWLERLNSEDTFFNEGYYHGSAVNYQILDSRIKEETSRRIVIRYDIKVVHNADFDTFPDGLGYLNANEFSNIQATVDGKLNYSENPNLIFRSAGDNIFYNQPFYKDYNLYVAGRPDYTFAVDDIVGKYIFALPMFKITRHNKKPYSLQNFNGSRTSVYRYQEANSSKNGDLLNNIRPDKICYDILDENDVLDIRKSISTASLNNYYLNKGLYDLFTGKLQTKEKTSVRRVQFGRKTVDYNDNGYVILHVNFNDNVIPDIYIPFTDGEDNDNTESEDETDNKTNSTYTDVQVNRYVNYSSNEPYYTPIYKDSMIGKGLYIDGRSEYAYTINNYDAENGTIDFYMQPYWDGHSNITQTLFRLLDSNGNTAVICKKVNEQLITDVTITYATALNNSIINRIIIDLTKYLIFSKRISTLRFSWSKNATLSKVLIYLNGITVGEMDYIGTTMHPLYLILGDKNDAINYAGLVLQDINHIEYELEQKYGEKSESWLMNDEIELAKNNIAKDEEDRLIFNNHLVSVDYNFETYTFDNSIILTEVSAINADGTILADTDSHGDSIALNDEDAQLLEFINKLNENEQLINSNFLLNTDQLYNGHIRIYSNEFTTYTELNSIANEERRRLEDITEARYKEEQILYELYKKEQEEIQQQRVNANYGFIIEELTVHAHSYEDKVNDGAYIYTTNSYWPGLPNDFISGQALILPSFNSLYRGYSDNFTIQPDTVKVVTGEKGIFKINAIFDNKRITEQPTIYSADGSIDYLGNILTLSGKWRYLKDQWVFTANDALLTKAVVVYKVELPNGQGYEDLPNEMLAAGLVTAEDVYEECSFARMNTTEFRPVQYLNPAKVSAAVDRAFDRATTAKNKHDCYARLLYYHVSGHANNHYTIPAYLYGYPVLNVIKVTGKTIENVQKIEDTDEEEGKFVIWLEESVAYGEIVEVLVALGGWSFDYETQSKTLISNIQKTQTITFKADGIHQQFFLPVYLENGGILKAVCSVTEIDNEGNEVQKFACFVNNEMYPWRVVENDGVTTEVYKNQLAEITVNSTSWNTPFMTISLNYTPVAGSVIDIPVLITYQPKQTEVLSLWYKYVPYQGILNKTHKKLKRLTEWKYFITTLSSGNDVLHPKKDNVTSLNNIVNRLPGGNTYASYLTGEKIIFDGDLSTGILNNLYSAYTITDHEINDDITIEDLNNISYFDLNKNKDSTVNVQERINKYLKADGNYELRFINKALFTSIDNKLDDTFFELDTDMEIYRNTIGFQDEKLQYTFNKFKAYLPDSLIGISKYTGMACLVVDETGQVLLFIMGSINNGIINKNEKVRENIVQPIYGDLFKLKNLPTTLQRF